MRKTLIYIVSLMISLLIAGTLWAKDKYTVTILPFTLNSAENIDYVKQGIEEMLSSRLSASDKISVTNRNIVARELKKINAKDISIENVYVLGKKLNSDYVVWGSITKIGNSISLDGKLVDIAQSKSDVSVFAQTQTLDDVIPKINDFSENIINHILGTTPQSISATATGTSVASTSPQAPAALSRESQIIASMKAGGKKGGTLTSVINTEFINAAEPFNRKEFWMSQKIPTEFKGIDIGDVNNDGLNEVVVIDKNTIYIYQKAEKDLRLLETIKGKSYHNYLAVDLADINRNGINEIIVTAINRSLLESFVLEFKNGKYETVAADLRWFFRVIDTSSIPLLVGQQYGFDRPFDTPIYEIIWKDGKYQPDQQIKIPSGLSVYGLTIDNIGIDGKEKVIALNDMDYLFITEKTNKTLGRLTSIGFTSEELIWKSDDVYGGSNNYIDNANKDDKDKKIFINLRILTYDTNKDGKKEIIVVKNLSSVGRVFQNLKLFTSSEIYNLEWDGMGLAENWRTKKINGYVSDYCMKDIDNDGKPEIVLALVQSVGASLRERSVLVVYELETE